MNFHAYLQRRYVEWCAACGERRTLTQFAEHLNISNQTLNQWMNGRARPRPEFVERLALALGLEVYDVLGQPRPDPVLFELTRVWPELGPLSKQQISVVLKRFTDRQRQKG
jgi:transcriptional regulator with XRE-family HTH domain